jgi:undecaprenyl-diphosphatase
MINNKIFFALYNFAHQSLLFDKVVVFFADIFPYIVILSAGIFLLIHHEVVTSKNPFGVLAQKWKEIVLVFFSGISAWCISQILKILIHTQRPFLVFKDVSSLLSESGFAFPSGHATFFMALGMAIYLSHKKAGYYFIFFAFLIGLARIIAGVHFPIDIIGGFILGIFVAYFVKFLYIKSHPFK